MVALDYFLMIAMIAVTVCVGIASGKKVKNADEYLTAGRSLNKLQAAFSMAATDFGGSGLVAAIGYSYLSGLGGMWWNLAAAPAFLFVGLYLAKKLNRLQSNTVPDYLGERYSDGCRIFASSTHFLANIALLSTQFTIATATFALVTGFDETLMLIAVMALVLLLTFIGGLRAVVNTDATLFVFIVLSVFVCLGITLNMAGGLSTIAARVSEGFLSIGSIGYAMPLSWVLMCVFSYSTNQNYVQRMICAKNENTASFGALFTAGFYVVISLALGVIGVTAHVLLPGLTDMNSIFPELMLAYFPAGLLGLGIAGVLAATISTASSILHSAATLFISDLYPAVCKTKAQPGLGFSRWVTIAIAAGALLISIFFKNIIDVIYIASLFYSTAVFFPLLLGMHSKRITAKAAMISMLGATAVGLIWELGIYGRAGILGAVPSNIMSIAASLCLLLVFPRKQENQPNG